MADNVQINTGSGPFVAADELVDTDLGSQTVQAQYVKLMDGTPNSFRKVGVDPSGGLLVSPVQGKNNLDEMSVLLLSAKLMSQMAMTDRSGNNYGFELR